MQQPWPLTSGSRNWIGEGFRRALKASNSQFGACMPYDKVLTGSDSLHSTIVWRKEWFSTSGHLEDTGFRFRLDNDIGCF